MKTNNDVTSKEMKELLKIAKRCMYCVETRGDLETRNTDSQDFLYAPVWGIKQALIDAYKLGKNSR